MGVRVSDDQHVCLYDSTSGTAFGPVLSSSFEADDFLSWLGNRDPRDMAEGKLIELHAQFVAMVEGERV
jgi:hypothetical protein